VVAVSAPTPPVPGPRPVPGPPPARESSAESTVAAVRAEVAELDRLAGLPVADHVARYDALHGTLSDALAAIDGV
jgi:hypothetical protein